MSDRRRVVLVSGSTRGIGKSIAERFVADGCIVVQNSRNVGNVTSLLGATHFSADVTKLSDCVNLIDSVVREFNRLDVLICNVGSGRDLSNNVLSSDRWDHFLKINLLTAANLVEAAIEPLTRSRGTAIAISSICGLRPIPNVPLEYSAAKAALNMHFQSLALKYGRDGIRFNVIAPGNVFFPGSTWDEKIAIDNMAVEEYLEREVPMNRFASPNEIANAAAFLASSDSGFTSGSILTIDGGQSL